MKFTPDGVYFKLSGRDMPPFGVMLQNDCACESVSLQMSWVQLQPTLIVTLKEKMETLEYFVVLNVPLALL